MTDKRIACIVFVIGFLILFEADAVETRRTRIIKTPKFNSDIQNTRFDRSQWNLTQKEWNRYQTLMHGIRGSISPANLSPVEVLGVHAQTDEERMKYARKWAEMIRDDTEQTLAFQKAYDAAWSEMNPSGQIIGLVGRRLAPSKLIQSGDLILLFLNLENCGECYSALTRVQRAINDQNVQLDIYFMDTQDKKDNAVIQEWAARQNFDLDRVKQGKITFNHNKGTLARMGDVLNATVPGVYRIRNNRIERMDYRSAAL